MNVDEREQNPQNLMSEGHGLPENFKLQHNVSSDGAVF